MKELKEHQSPMTIEEQVENLKKIGLIVEDEEYAKRILNDISYVRNVCAHYGRLYNAKLSKTPILYKEYTQIGIRNNRIFGVLLCLKHLLKEDTHWNLFVDKLELLFEKYESVDIDTMGFPKNWKELLEREKTY